MKKLIASLCAVAALSALAADNGSTVVSESVFGVLKVTPGSSATEVCICVPWVAAGTSGSSQTVLVKDLVKTSNLADGSVLLQYVAKSKKYKGWTLTNGSWTGASSVYKNTASQTVVDEAGTDTDTISRGDALIVRPTWKATDGTYDKNLYLYGQYQSNGIGEQTLTAGAWNLIAPPNTSSESISLNAYTWGNVNAKDVIYLQASTGLRIKALPTISTVDSKTTVTWKVFASGAWTADYAKIQPGQGAWYVSAGSADPTVTFETTAAASSEE